jgi:NADH-quinone oxidoreductase subunit C
MCLDEAVTGEELAGLVAARLGPSAVSEIGAAGGPTVTADVASRRWTEALTFARDELGCDVFDWLSAVDELPDGFAIVIHVYSLEGLHHLVIRTRVGRDAPHLPTATPVYPGAARHEREAAETFGVRFDGHPDPSPLLPDGFEGLSH